MYTHEVVYCSKRGRGTIIAPLVMVQDERRRRIIKKNLCVDGRPAWGLIYSLCTRRARAPSNNNILDRMYVMREHEITPGAIIFLDIN